MNQRDTHTASTAERLRQKGIRSPRVDAFAFADDLRDVIYGWHSHSYHQLLYSFSGLTRLETKSGFWLLPPQRAAFIPAGVRHSTVQRRVTAGSICFKPSRYEFPGLTHISVCTATPLLREMISFSMRWTNQERSGDLLAENFFQTVALYCRELVSSELPYQLPQGTSPPIKAAIDFTLAHLEEASFVEVAKAVHCSPRTLRRHFLEETGITWRNFITRARLLRALELLIAGDSNVTETALASGFTNLSAFSNAFFAFTGQNPGQFRRHYSLK